MALFISVFIYFPVTVDLQLCQELSEVFLKEELFVVKLMTNP